MNGNKSRGQLLKSGADSAARLVRDRRELVESLADRATSEKLKRVAKPNSVSRTLRKTGAALILAPDPVTAVPGVLMLGASLAMKGKEPLTPTSVVEESKNLLDELGSQF